MSITASRCEHDQGVRLHLQNQLREAEPFYRRAIDIDPSFRIAWINLGLVMLADGRLEEAAACQREALLLDPESADALNNLGMTHFAQGHVVEAENCFQAAVRLQPEHANAMLNLGSARQILNRVEDAEQLFRQALDLGVDPGRGKSNLALALLEQARPEEAEAQCREALAIHPDYPEARANLALGLLLMGRLEEGWREYESRWEVEAMAAPLPAFAQPRWTGQALQGKTVLLYAEQGFGDTLQFCRYVTLVAAAGGRVLLVVPKELRNVMSGLAGVAELLTDDDLLPAFDYHCPLLSLPFAFGTTLETIPSASPYLTADPSPWAGFLGTLSGLKVGLVWAGKSRAGQPHAVAIDRRRSMRLADMVPLLDVPHCSFVSLQLGPKSRQMRSLANSAVLHDVSDWLTDWADTAALIAGLDLVIAVDTAVAHLAGALGKPVWLLNRFDTCWRWQLNREDTPWYPSMRQFRQAVRGEWAPVIEQVRLALTQLALAQLSR